MSIRQIALELYRQEKEISRLKKEIASAEPGEVEAIQEKLNKATLERTTLRKMLDSKKKNNP